ncbi:aldehyde dehydrogenase family protein [Streptomyces anulatus]|uniref:aldehyde dehydrogenase family protein n=1 Tax=Streptomyces anulatus TaxID=1892 RepID=UPI00367C6747
MRHYVGGGFDASGVPFPLVDPATGRTVGAVPEASRELVDRAVAAARAALRGPWAAWSPAERSRLLHRITDGIEARFEEFSAAECADTGKPRELPRRSTSRARWPISAPTRICWPGGASGPGTPRRPTARAL